MSFGRLRHLERKEVSLRERDLGRFPIDHFHLLATPFQNYSVANLFPDIMAEISATSEKQVRPILLELYFLREFDNFTVYG